MGFCDSIMEAERGMFFLSAEFIEQSEIVPSVPTSYLSRGGYIDDTIPRAYVSEDIGKLFAFNITEDILKEGIDKHLFFVYMPSGEYSSFVPPSSKDKVANETGVEWMTIRSCASLVGAVKVTGVKDVIPIDLGNITINYPVFEYQWIPIPKQYRRS